MLWAMKKKRNILLPTSICWCKLWLLVLVDIFGLWQIRCFQLCSLAFAVGFRTSANVCICAYECACVQMECKNLWLTLCVMHCVQSRIYTEHTLTLNDATMPIRLTKNKTMSTAHHNLHGFQAVAATTAAAIAHCECSNAYGKSFVIR